MRIQKRWLPVVLLVGWVGWPVSAAQIGLVLPDETGETASADEAPGARWVELRALGTAGRVVEIWPAGGWQPGQRIPIELLTEGRYLLCFGGEDIATRCGVRDLTSGDSVILVAAPGVDVVGRFVEGREVVASRVTLGPVGLSVPGVFLLPLDRAASPTADRPAGTAESGPDPFLRRFESGDTGHFRLPRLAAGEYLLEAELATGRVVRERIVVPVAESLRDAEAPKAARNEPGKPLVHDLGDLWVDPGLVVEFLVSDGAGQPLEGAMVVVSQGDPESGIEELAATTGAYGVARLSGLRPDRTTRTTCRADGFEPRRQRYDVPPSWVECVLRPHARLSGTVRDQDEQPVGGATITLRHASEGFLRAFSDRRGAYLFEQLPSGEYAQVVTAPGHGADRRAFELAPGERREAEVVLPAGRGLELEVVDAETAEPVPGAVVRVVDPPGGDRAVADDRGELRLVIDSAAPTTLEAAAVGYPRHALTLTPDEMAESGHEPRQIELRVGGRIRAVVHDSEGSGPCVGCRITIGGEGLVTDGQGVALSDPLEPGEHIVQRSRIRNQGTLMTVEGGAEVRQVLVRARETTTIVLGAPRQEIQVVFEPTPVGWDLQIHGVSSSYHRPAFDGSYSVPRGEGDVRELWLVEPSAEQRAVRVGRIPPDFEGERLDLFLSSASVRLRPGAREARPADQSIRLESAEGVVIATASLRGADPIEIPWQHPGQIWLRMGGQLFPLTVPEHGVVELGPIYFLQSTY